MPGRDGLQLLRLQDVTLRTGLSLGGETTIRLKIRPPYLLKIGLASGRKVSSFAQPTKKYNAGNL